MSAMNSFEQFSSKRNFRFGVVPNFYEITEETLPVLLETSTNPVSFANRVRACDGWHLGFYFPNQLPLLFEYSGTTPEERVAFINHKDIFGRHMGFSQQSAESLRFLIENCGDPAAFVKHTDDYGRHMGFEKQSAESLRFIIENSGTSQDERVAFVKHTDDYGRHMGFEKQSAESLRFIIENSGTSPDERAAFVNHTDYHWEHMGFLTENTEVLRLLIENCGDSTAFVYHENKCCMMMGYGRKELSL